MNLFLKIINLISLINKVVCIVPIVPLKPGAIYQNKIYIPIIGKQIIEAEIISDNLANIRLKGLINEQGSAKYFNKNNKDIMNLSYNLKNIIKKYNTELSFPYYDIENDEILFNLNIKKFNYNKQIKMTAIDK